MDKPEALVTVIIPAYNRSAYIDHTVRSVLEQTYPSVELIVIDDGSSDGTYERLQAYGDRIQLLTHEGHANKGQSAALNLGLKAARGEYIAILDSDDYWAPDKLERQVAYLEAHPDIGLVYCNGYHVDAEGRELHPFHPDDHSEPNDPNALLLDCYMLLPQSSLVRSEVFRRAGLFDENLRAAQDHDMLIRISELTQFAYQPEYGFFYRRHGGSISVHGLERRWRNGFVILDKARRRYPYRSATIRRRRAVLFFRLGQVFGREGKRLKAIPYLLLSGLLDPVRALGVVLGRESTNK